MLRAFVNCFKIPELRKRLLFTLAVLAVVRLLANIPCPGVQPEGLAQLFEQLKHSGGGGLVGMFDVFTGGALQQFAIAALGIMPYITASIILSLLAPVLPALERLKREGESGHQKMNQYTRYLTLVICIVQGWGAALIMEQPSRVFGGISGNVQIVTEGGFGFKLLTVIILTAGTMLLVWLGEQITDKGVGNGASMIITIGIIDRLPKAVVEVYDLWQSGGSGTNSFTTIHVLLLAGIFYLVIMGTVALTQGVRKVPIQHARARTGRAALGAGGASFFPLRVNFASVMPIIFASALLMFPPFLLGLMMTRLTWVSYLSPYFEYATTSYMLMYAALVIVFCFFWTANQFNPVQIADDLKRGGAYIPGVRPGKPTADFMDYTMTRVTTAGAFFLTIIALLPMLFHRGLSIPGDVSQFFGGTSLLISVGVLLDMMRQIESHMIQYGGYEGFLHNKRVRPTRRVAGPMVSSR